MFHVEHSSRALTFWVGLSRAAHGPLQLVLGDGGGEGLPMQQPRLIEAGAQTNRDPVIGAVLGTGALKQPRGRARHELAEQSERSMGTRLAGDCRRRGEQQSGEEDQPAGLHELATAGSAQDHSGLALAEARHTKFGRPIVVLPIVLGVNSP